MPMTLLHKNIGGECIYCTKPTVQQKPDEPCPGPTGERETSDSDAVNYLAMASEMSVQVDAMKRFARDCLRLSAELNRRDAGKTDR